MIAYSFCIWSDFQKQHQYDENYIGKYQLSENDDCPNCILELKDDNSFKMTKIKKNIETGTWWVHNGTDVFILYLNDKEFWGLSSAKKLK